ncbi:MAG: hypothetical protein QOI01_5907 [Mycobacterium sp.]|jgi:hypothetical protein|nr:hypothetical protein [Mycobacterium sp.]
MLVGGAALALLGGTVATACGSSPPAKDIDALLGQLKRAQSDGELAGNAATAAPRKLAAALNAVAGQRAAHAKALSDEITRISGEAPPTTSASSASSATSATSATFSPSAPITTSGPPPKPPTAADVVAALQQSAEGASLLATQQSGYRAGLLGSIAAACTAAATVALTGSGQAS